MPLGGGAQAQEQLAARIDPPPWRARMLLIVPLCPASTITMRGPRCGAAPAAAAGPAAWPLPRAPLRRAWHVRPSVGAGSWKRAGETRVIYMYGTIMQVRALPCVVQGGELCFAGSCWSVLQLLSMPCSCSARRVARLQGGEIIGWQNMYTREGDYGTAVFYPDQESSAVILPECGISDCRNAFCSGARGAAAGAAAAGLLHRRRRRRLLAGVAPTERGCLPAAAPEKLTWVPSRSPPERRPDCDAAERAAGVWRARDRLQGRRGECVGAAWAQRGPAGAAAWARRGRSLSAAWVLPSWLWGFPPGS